MIGEAKYLTKWIMKFADFGHFHLKFRRREHVGLCDTTHATETKFSTQLTLPCRFSESRLSWGLRRCKKGLKATKSWFWCLGSQNPDSSLKDQNKTSWIAIRYGIMMVRGYLPSRYHLWILLRIQMAISARRKRHDRSEAISWKPGTAIPSKGVLWPC